MKEKIKYLFPNLLIIFFLLRLSYNLQFWWDAQPDPSWMDAQKCSHEVNLIIEKVERVAFFEEPVTDRTSHDSMVILRRARLFLTPTLVDAQPSDLGQYPYVLLYLRDENDQSYVYDFEGEVVLTCENYVLLKR